jgi:hypothetical protein
MSVNTPASTPYSLAFSTPKVRISYPAMDSTRCRLCYTSTPLRSTRAPAGQSVIGAHTGSTIDAPP